MKTLQLLFLISFFSNFAHAECKDLTLIKKAAKKTFKKFEHPYSGNVTYVGVTKTGKDKFTTEMSWNDECIAEATVFMKKDTCEVQGSFKFIPDGACG